jgi:hypothetical protein
VFLIRTPTIRLRGKLATLLRGVVFVGEAMLGAGLQLQRISLHAIGGGALTLPAMVGGPSSRLT